MVLQRIIYFQNRFLVKYFLSAAFTLMERANFSCFIVMNNKAVHVHYDMILNGNAETSKALLAFIVSFCVIKFCSLSLFWTKII